MSNQETAVTLGDYGKVAIKQHFKKIDKHEAKVLKDKDPEELHQMRVGIRRLRSAMIGFDQAIALPKTATEKSAGDIGKVLGDLRDLDVLKLAIESKYLPNLPSDEQEYIAEVIKVISKKRKQAFKKVKSTLKSKEYQEFKQGLENWLEKPKYKAIAATNIDLTLADLLLPQASKLLLHPGWLLGVEIVEGNITFNPNLSIDQVQAILETQENSLHSLRKEAKKTRYNMALFTQFYDERYLEYLDKIADLQEVLGEIQDCYVLREFLSEIFDKKLEKKLPSLIKQFSEKRYQKWQEWQDLQQQFLDLKTRHEFLRAIIG
ncbi:CHAD domain containing protein [Chondrocystis sp. NIES-4102]|nr:CHAD domain containing protein [Chondrocystis sp. NIES-4102]